MTTRTTNVCHSLGVHLVERPVDADGRSEARHTFVLLEPFEDGCQRGGDQARRAERHDGTNLMEETRTETSERHKSTQGDAASPRLVHRLPLAHRG